MIFRVFVESGKLCLDCTGMSGLEFGPLVFDLWASLFSPWFQHRFCLWFWALPGTHLIEITAQVEGGFEFSGPYYQSNNCLIQGTFISELVYAGLRKVTVELFDWTAPPQPGGTLFEGPADIYIYIYGLLHFFV